MKVTIQSDVFARTLKACAVAASRDRQRPHLSSVWLRATKDGQSFMYATDGHWAAVARIDVDVDVAGDLPLEIRDVPRVLGVLPNRRALQKPVTITRNGNAATVATTDFSITVVTPDVQPLALEDVVPRGLSKRKHLRYTFGTELVQKVATAIQHIAPPSRKRGVGMRFYAMGEANTSPSLVCSSQAPEFFAVLMPMRCDTRRHMDWWFDVADRLTAERKAKTEATKVEATAQAAAE
jgi:hypothetical protein